MKPRVAVWCPQGRESLPLTAALCRSQIPAELIVWSSDEDRPAVPNEVVADVWLVLCAGDPPPPPTWCRPSEGQWLLFPGSVAWWSEHTRGRLADWDFARVLCDLLPDEFDMGRWFDLQAGHRLTWLPAVGAPQGASAPRISFAVVTTPPLNPFFGALAPVLANALGGEERRLSGKSVASELTDLVTRCDLVLVNTDDPILTGIAMEAAARRGARLLVWSERRRAGYRRCLLGGGAAWLGGDERMIAPALRRLVAMSRAQPPSRGEPQVDFRWETWLEAQGRRAADVVPVEVAAANFLLAYCRRGRDCESAQFFAWSVQSWLQAAHAELWARDVTEIRRQERDAAVWLLERRAANGDGSAQEAHLLARLHAMCGTPDRAVASIERFMRDSGKAGELPCTVALILHLRGAQSAARAVLERWADEAPTAPFVSFYRAVMGELLGLGELTDRELAALSAQCPAFIDDAAAADVRWILAAWVFERAGHRRAATICRERAQKSAPGALHLLSVRHEEQHDDAAAMRWSGWARRVERGGAAALPPNDPVKGAEGRRSPLTSLAAKRLVFTITTGRSGTCLLNRMGALLHGVAAFHEPEPKFSRVLRDVQQREGYAREWLERIKLPAIAAVPMPVYFETSHLFGKGFVEPLLELGFVPDLVVLRRDARAVARSLYALGTIPARSETGRSFLLQPDDPGVLPLPDWGEMHDYQLCFWYCLEMERRARLYAELIRQRGGRVAEVSFAQLLGGGFVRVVRELALDSHRGSDFAVRLAATEVDRVNDKADLKRLQARPALENLEMMEAVVLDRTGVAANFAP